MLALVVVLQAGCFASLVDGRRDDVDAGAPDLPTAVDGAGAGAVSCEPAPLEPPEVSFDPVGADAECRGASFAAARTVMLTAADVTPGGVLRLDTLTSLTRDGDYRCGIEVAGLGDDAPRIAEGLGAMRFVLVQARDGALVVLPNDVFCEAPLCPPPIGLWVGALRLPSDGPTEAVDWLRLDAGEGECRVPSRCPQERFPLQVTGRSLDLRVAPGERDEAPLMPPVLGAERLVARVFQSGTDCGPADASARPVVRALYTTP